MAMPPSILPGAKPDSAAEFEAEFVGWLENPDDFAARELLAEGWPVYYVEDDTPEGLVIKKHPDGRRQLISGWGVKQKVMCDL